MAHWPSQGVQTLSEVAVAAWVCRVPSAQDCVTEAQTRFDVVVGAVVWYWLEVQVVRGLHWVESLTSE